MSSWRLATHLKPKTYNLKPITFNLEPLLQLIIAVSLDELLQQLDRLHQISAPLTISHPSWRVPDQGNARYNVRSLVDSGFYGFQNDDALLRMSGAALTPSKSRISVCFREGAIDRNGFAALFYRRFAFLHLDRHVAIHNQAVFSRHVELGENFVTKPHLIDQTEIRILGFDVRFGSLIKSVISVIQFLPKSGDSGPLQRYHSKSGSSLSGPSNSR